MWKPTKSSPSRPSSASIAGTRSASTPNAFGPPPMCMPAVFSSKSGLTRIATVGLRPWARPISAIARISASDSRLTTMPAATACASSSRVLPGPAKLIFAAGIAGVERDPQFAGRGDVDAVDERREMAAPRRASGWPSWRSGDAAISAGRRAARRHAGSRARGHRRRTASGRPARPIAAAARRRPAGCRQPR